MRRDTARRALRAPPHIAARGAAVSPGRVGKRTVGAGTRGGMNRIAAMIARSLPALVAGAALVAGLALTAIPALAQPGTDPAAVLAGKSSPRGKGFSDRIARIGAIMGSDADRGASLRIPKRPDWTRTHAADALAGAR